MADIEVHNLREAVRLAEQWKAEGSHTWLRGQNKPWPLSFSPARVAVLALP